MSLIYLLTTNFRNLQNVEIEPSPYCNVIYGENGSGKTNLLESIYYLGLGKTFRTNKADRAIAKGKDKFSIFAKIHSPSLNDIIPTGIERSARGDTKIRINGSDLDSKIELVRNLPLLHIHPSSYQLLDSGPKYRRDFLNWGMFHVEHSFIDLWKRLDRVLRQRNAALKDAKTGSAEPQIWNKDFINLSEELHKKRQNYLNRFIPHFDEIKGLLMHDIPVSIHYNPGWNGEDLASQLEHSYYKDKAFGYTTVGPQRAEIQMQHQDTPVHEILSRGQQKLLIYTLKLAQGHMLRTAYDKNCVYLFDDFPAELDSKNREKISEILQTLNSQIFVTGVSANSFSTLFAKEKKMFHVEHGVVTESQTNTVIF